MTFVSNEESKYLPFQEATYEFVLARFGKDFLLFEDEEYYYSDSKKILFADSDVNIPEDFLVAALADGYELLVVDGNLSVQGKLAYFAYFVTGDVTADYLLMSDIQVCLGTETVNYLQEQIAEDQEESYDGRGRTISAPLFISWFYDLTTYTFAPDTKIFALCDTRVLGSFKTENVFFPSHDSAYVLKPELASIDYFDDDGYYWYSDRIYRYLAEGKTVFIEGFDTESFPLWKKGKEAFEVFNDMSTAFVYFKELTSRAPSFHFAYYLAGSCLYRAGDWAAAKSYFKRAQETDPKNVKYTAVFVAQYLEWIEQLEHDPTKQSVAVSWRDMQLTELPQTKQDQDFWNKYFHDRAPKKIKMNLPMTSCEKFQRSTEQKICCGTF